MTTIYLIRHAEAEGNLYRRIQGWYDSLITGNGYRQIAALEQRFAPIHVDAVYSSDLFRTMTTAKAVYGPKNLSLHTDPGLREIHLGDWEDQTWGYVRHFDEKEMLRFNRTDPTWRAPHGENLQEVGDRMVSTICRLAKGHPGQTLAMFSHGAAIRQALGMIHGLPPERWKEVGHGDNTAVTKLLYDGVQLTVEYESDASHLTPELSTLAKQAWWRKDDTKAQDVSLWFRPIHWDTEQDIYLDARSEAWHTTHGQGPRFDGDKFLSAAQDHLRDTPRGVTLAMFGDKLVGVLELDVHRYAEDNAGYLPFCYIVPELREQNLGVQLIGEAVSFFRPLGRDKLRLRCAPYNGRAQRFYSKYGFVKVGEEQNSPVPLDILEKYIGFDR